MSESKQRPRSVISVEDANRMLPLVSAIVADLAQLTRDVAERRSRLDILIPSGEEDDRDNIYRDELREIEREVRSDSQRLREYVEELRQLGLSPAGDHADGIVEFPSELDGREVMLSWKLGEPELLYYRELAEDTRLPLIAGTLDGSLDETAFGGQ